ncbi:MAG: prolyl oligopeptidase family serine peptidase [Bdellovibrionia bacterium]
MSQKAVATEVEKPQPQVISLPSLQVSNIYIAGISSGAFMVQQMQVAYPELFAGVGMIAGGVWSCSDGDWQRASRVCMKDPNAIDLSKIFLKLDDLVTQKKIGEISKLKNHRSFIFQGQKDSVLAPASAVVLEQFYQKLGAPYFAVTHLPAGHGYPTNKSDKECGLSQLPWLINCEYDLSGHLLQYWLGSLQPAEKQKNESLYYFNQKEFASVESKVSDVGRVYIPEYCQKNKCHLVMMLHGCLMGPAIVGDQFVVGTELLDWAEGNRFVVVFPATQRSARNPNGCWDWFGYTGEDYLLRDGPQMLFLKNIISRINSGGKPH